MKNCSKKKKEKINPWAFVSALLFLVLIFCALYVSNICIDKKDIRVEMCKSISGTPSWADEEGKIVDSGYVNFTEHPNVVRDYLIPNHIYLLYASGCSWCEKQIMEFGEEQWNYYLESGYTVNCKEVLE